jgi:hypothetical protein
VFLHRPEDRRRLGCRRVAKPFRLPPLPKGPSRKSKDRKFRRSHRARGGGSPPWQGAGHHKASYGFRSCDLLELGPGQRPEIFRNRTEPTDSADQAQKSAPFATWLLAALFRRILPVSVSQGTGSPIDTVPPCTSATASSTGAVVLTTRWCRLPGRGSRASGWWTGRSCSCAFATRGCRRTAFLNSRGTGPSAVGDVGES